MNLILAGLAVAAVMAVLVKFTVLSGNPVRRARSRIRMRMKPGPGFASIVELRFRWSRLAAVHHGKRARPGMDWKARHFGKAHQFAVRLGRAQFGHRVFARMEDQTLILAPQRTGKSGLLADRILTHPGAVLSTTTRADIYQLTSGARAQLGPVLVFNPESIGNIPSTFGWDMIIGCSCPATALRRASALVGPTDGQGDMSFWSGKAEIVIAALLHAADLIHVDMSQVWAWSNRADPAGLADAARKPGASAELFRSIAEIYSDSKSADSIRMTMARSLSWLAVPALRAMVTAPFAEPFDAGRWALDKGTIYLIGNGDSETCAPLFRAFAGHVFYESGLAGTKTPSGKLDPPVFFGLDELATICPVPLPRWLADSAGKGILIAAVVHGTSQLEEMYGASGAATVWACCGVKLILHGVSDDDTLESISKLCGMVPDGDSVAAVVEPALIRQLPRWYCLVVAMDCAPVVVRFRPVWHRLAYRLGRNLPAHRAFVRLYPVLDVPEGLEDAA